MNSSLEKNYRDYIELATLTALLSTLLWQWIFVASFSSEVYIWMAVTYSVSCLIGIKYHIKNKSIEEIIFVLPYYFILQPFLSQKFAFLIGTLPLFFYIKKIYHGLQKTYLADRSKGVLVLLFGHLATHLIASMWHQLQPLGDELITSYINATYWTITTLSTIGYGDITPVGNASKIFTMGIMLIGVIMYGLIIGQVSNMIANYNQRKNEQQVKLRHLLAYMKFYDVPKKIKNEAFIYYQNHLNKGINEIEKKVISELPSFIQSELHLRMNIKNLKKIDMFKGSSEACLIDIAKRLKQVEVPPGEVLIKAGDMGREMYLISHGEIDVKFNGETVAQLHDGDYFGEVALLEDRPRVADVTSLTYSNLYLLEKDDFLEALRTHKTLQKQVDTLAKTRRN